MAEPVPVRPDLAAFASRRPEGLLPDGYHAGTVGLPPERVAQLEAEQAARHREEHLAALLGDLCPPRFRTARLDDLDLPVRHATGKWLADLDAGTAGNLLILGPVGTGKTHAAIAAGRAAVERAPGARRVLFRPVGDLLATLRPDGGRDPAFYTSVDVLILDDLGAERLTDWGAEQLYLVANGRWLGCRPTVVTSNLAAGQLADALGERTWDRLRDGARALALSGGSRRRPASPIVRESLDTGGDSR